MAKGIHSIYACSHSDFDRKAHIEDYLVGRFIGDHWADQEFGNRLKRIEKKIVDTWGHGSVIWSWSPADVKPYKPLTTEQRLARALTKAQNKYRKNVQGIIEQNFLFQEAFIKEEEEKLKHRNKVLKTRYQGLMEKTGENY